MKIRVTASLSLLLSALSLALLPHALFSQTPHGQRKQHDDVSQMDLSEARAKLASAPLSFARNLGQWPQEVRFASQMRGLDLWVTDSSILYDLNIIQELGDFPGNPTTDPAEQHLRRTVRRKGHLLHMRFAGANPEAFAEGGKLMEGRRNYFIGNDPRRWASNVPMFSESRIREIYKGIDILFHFDNGLPRYDFLVAPGADPATIRIRLDGADNVSVTPAGELAIATTLGVVQQRRLFAYQEIGGRKRQIPCSFRKHPDGTIGFALASYDAKRPLVIDPILYSTFLGGSGNDGATSIVGDLFGTVHLTGYAGAPSPIAKKFPTTTGAYQITEQGNSDVFVARMNSNGNLIFSTIIGGDGFDDGRAISIAGGGITICGFTSSPDFPTTAGSLSPNYNNGSHDAFVLRLNGSGSGFIYSTFLGGSGGDAAYALAVDPAGNTHLCGHTFSDDFPTTPGAYDATHNGAADIFVATLNSSGSKLLSGTYLGGSEIDRASSIIYNNTTGSSLITGSSLSKDFPTTTTNISNGNRNSGGYDVIYASLQSSGTRLAQAFYLGGSKDDHGEELILDLFGGATICGSTSSPDFPVAGDAISPRFAGGVTDGFVTRLTPSGTGLSYSTFIGGSGDDFITALGYVNQRFWLGGYSASHDFPHTSPAVDTTHNGGHDGFVMLLDLFSDSLYYSSFIGGTDRDVINDIQVVGGSGGISLVLYIAGTSTSRNFPTTLNAYTKNLTPLFYGEQEPIAPSYDAFFMRFDPKGVVLRTQTPGNQILLCPNGTFHIEWLSYDLNTIRIFILDESGTKYAGALLNNGPARELRWEWLIPGNQPPGTRFRIAILDVMRNDIGDTADVDFTVIEEPKLIKGISDVTVCPGEKVTFAAEAEGYKIAYRWRRNNFTIFGATGPAYVIDSVTAADTGVYELAVYDACGSIRLAQTARVRLKPIASIIEHPAEARACSGTPASFSVTAEGDGLQYQWYKDGKPVPGATSPTLAFDTVGVKDQGIYTCHVINDACPGVPIVSKPARLVVVYERIMEQPKSLIVKVGGGASFHIVATGINLQYQWRKDGVDIPGATTSTYTIKKVKLSDAGTYDVIITGECELDATSAVLTVENTSAVTGEPIERMAPWSITVHPNPLHTRGTIRLSSPLADGELRNAELVIFDMLGRKVLDLSEELREGGYESISFDATALPAGVYRCRLSVEGKVAGCAVVVER